MAPVHKPVNSPGPAYHAVPPGWSAEEIAARHRALGGVFPLEPQPAAAQAHPPYLTDRPRWLRYIATLRALVAGIRADDAAAVHLAVEYICLNYHGSYSGFLRARLARALKSAALTEAQKQALDAHFLALVETRNYAEEFRIYRKLWAGLISEETVEKMRRHARKTAPDSPHARWLAELGVPARNHRLST